MNAIRIDHCLLAGLVIAGTLAPAIAVTTPPRPPAPDAQVVEQKITLVSRMLHGSPVATRIAASGNAAAHAHVKQAEQLLQRSHALVGANDLVGADGVLNEAMWQIGKARELVPDPAAKEIGERARFAQTAHGVELLDAAYQQHLARTGHQADSDLARARALAEEARQMATAEKYLEANALLSRARDLMLASYHRHLGSATIIYAETFVNSAGKYAYELDRYRDYESLLPIALRDLNVSRETSALVNRVAERAHALHGQAVQRAERKDFNAAIRLVTQATAQLQRALTVAGVVVPQSIPGG